MRSIRPPFSWPDVARRGCGGKRSPGGSGPSRWSSRRLPLDSANGRTGSCDRQWPLTIDHRPLNDGRTMATLLEQVTRDIADAMRQKNQATLAPLRMLKAALMNREVEKGRALDDAESLQVVGSLVKQRRDSIEQFRAGGRQDLVDKEQAEITFLERYLPPAADDDAIAQAI